MVISFSTFSPMETLLSPPNHLNNMKKKYPLLTIHNKPTKRPRNSIIVVESSPFWCSCSASSSSSKKIVRNPQLDKRVVKHSKLRFVQKLKTLLLSKPRHFMPLRVLSKCRSYLSLPPKRSILSMIKRYPAIFQLFSTPSDLLAVQLTPAAESLAAEEAHLKNQISMFLASKLQKLLMLSLHRRLLLSKLAHLGPDLGLPPNFRSRLCNDHPDRFKTVDTSYGRALELVSWDPDLAIPLPPSPHPCDNDRIIDRPPRFKQLRLMKGLNVKRKHRDFLIRFNEMPEINPYTAEAKVPHTMEAEKKACAVVREVLGLTVEKRTLVDHITHFRHDFGLSNKVRGMLVRHPDLFYVSLKGQRDSVFLVEGYDDRGRLRQLDGDRDELLVAEQKLMELVREGKRMRRERRNCVNGVDDDDDNDDDDIEEEDEEEEESDGFEELFEAGIEEDWEDFAGVDDVIFGGDSVDKIENFWTFKASSKEDDITGASPETW
ncbi:hypothetical protein AAC387_Pa03g3988 [Persea americana]